ncbi:Outer membrane protein OmpA [Chitinophaga sp. CF118]|uniref:OmpA family protein n=1 Tax=Chitinophaga sp. CF118 TaxID=1884367 RepID=UPI0008EA9914|nr:OmpA family protein [Chitinophaga sp. CF118]SFD90384.1 Outer membrane protein OmpA [Chitinophaga sp. CF118]
MSTYVIKSILGMLFCCYTLELPAQNLVPNASFEDVNICTEYIAPCAPSAWVAVAPEVIKMKYLCNGTALQGQHHVSLLLEGRDNPDTRVYIQTRLLCPMEKGITYRIRFYMNTENYPLRAGIRFDTAFIFTENAGCLSVPASMELNEEDQQKKLWRLNHPWYMLEKNYVATQRTTHIIIGNFKAPQKKEGYALYNNAQLFIDSISITPLIETSELCKEADSIHKFLYAEHHRHTIPDTYVSPPGKQILHKLDGNKEGCDTIILKDDLFSPDRNTINSNYRQQIDDVLKSYRNNSKKRIQLIGYSWQAASDEYNKIISFDKVKALATYLVYNEGYSFEDFDIRGMGKKQPRYDTVSGNNNRIEMILCRIPDTVKVRIVPKPDTLVIPDILFKFNSSELNTALYGALDSLIRKIPRDGSVQLQVTGYTDNAGNDEYNYNLSLKRANAVAGYMQQSGLGNDIRQITGAGETFPVADNRTPAGRKKNRRVEIIIFHSAD